MDLTKSLDVGRAFLRSEIENVRRFDMPWRRRLWLYWNGFLSSKGAIWDLTGDTVDEYLSDFEYRDVKRVGRPFGAGLKNKVFFHLIVSRTHASLLPGIYCLIHNGRFVGADRPGWIQSFEQLFDRLHGTRVVVKPVTAAKGDGVRTIDGRDGRLRIDGRAVDRTELIENLTQDRDLLLTEHVAQAEYAANIYPQATNTLRLLTMIDPETGNPFIARGTHRFGTAASGRIDNWSAGGISAGIDLAAGELEKAVSLGGSNGVSWVETHPETGAQIAGVSIPGWEQIKETVLNLAGEYGWLWPHVGWDVVARDDDGSIAVLEGDSHSIDADQQAHGPLLADVRVRRFYEHHGVLSNQRSEFLP